MLPEGSSEQCVVDKFSLFTKAFLFISSGPLWQVEGELAKFSATHFFPTLRCQKLSRRSFFTSKEMEHFGFVTQPDQASAPCVLEYKLVAAPTKDGLPLPCKDSMRFQSRYFFWCLKDSLRRIRKQTDLLDLASNENNTGSAALSVAICTGFYLSNAKMSWTPPTACSLSQHWRIGSSAGQCGRVQTANAHWSVNHQGQENLVVPVKKVSHFCIEDDGWRYGKVSLSLQMWHSAYFPRKSRLVVCGEALHC